MRRLTHKIPYTPTEGDIAMGSTILTFIRTNSLTIFLAFVAP
jgi:hypothetical protein